MFGVQVQNGNEDYLEDSMSDTDGEEEKSSKTGTFQKKEKIKESKSWITKKSKKKIKDIKNNLKKHISINDLPKADHGRP